MGNVESSPPHVVTLTGADVANLNVDGAIAHYRRECVELGDRVKQKKARKNDGTAPADDREDHIIYWLVNKAMLARATCLLIVHVADITDAERARHVATIASLTDTHLTRHIYTLPEPSREIPDRSSVLGVTKGDDQPWYITLPWIFTPSGCASCVTKFVRRSECAAAMVERDAKRKRV